LIILGSGKSFSTELIDFLSFGANITALLSIININAFFAEQIDKGSNV